MFYGAPRGVGAPQIRRLGSVPRNNGAWQRPTRRTPPRNSVTSGNRPTRGRRRAARTRVLADGVRVPAAGARGLTAFRAAEMRIPAAGARGLLSRNANEPWILQTRFGGDFFGHHTKPTKNEGPVATMRLPRQSDPERYPTPGDGLLGLLFRNDGFLFRDEAAAPILGTPRRAGRVDGVVVLVD